MTSPSRSPYEWRKSSFTDGVQCAEVRRRGDYVELRDDLDPDTVVSMTAGSFYALARGIKAGEFDDLV